MSETVLTAIAELNAMTTPALRKRWRELFDTDPPRYNRAHLLSRLIYRVQELHYGGLKPSSKERLQRLGDKLDGGDQAKRRVRVDNLPVPGTKLVREWQGVEHTVTVLKDGYEWEGRRYKSLSGAAKAISGTKWSGPLFFGLRSAGARS